MKFLAHWFSVLALAAVSPLVGAIDTKCKSVPPFAKVDRDQNGYIGTPEAHAVHGLTSLFRILDSDKNGSIWFEAGLKHDAVHDLQHASFLASALLFWWALVRRRPDGIAVLYVLTTLLHTGFLGALLTFAPNVWYPTYADAVNPWGFAALDDQQLGGLIMWVPAGAIFIVAGLLLLAKWLRTLEHTRPVAWKAADDGS